MIKLAVDTLGPSDLQALTDWISTRPQLTKGDLVLDFEKKFAAWLGVKEAVFVNSGSSANLLMIHGLMVSGQLSPGDKVVIPSICWATDAAPLLQLGLQPVVVDVNLRNIGINVTELEKCFEKFEPKALLLVSVLGMAPDMEDIEYLCHKWNVTLLEDNCESIGSTYNGHKLGTFGYASTISTYFGHHMSTIEGGLIFTNDEKFADVLRMTRAHGWDRDLSPEAKESFRSFHGIDEFNARYTFYFPGFNFRPTEINAFLGLRQLQKLDHFIEKRKENFEFYQEHVKNEFWKPEIPKENLVSNLGYPIITKNRDRLAAALIAENVECRPFISGNIDLQPAFAGKMLRSDLSAANIIHDYGMYVPNHSELTNGDMYHICKIINKYV